MRQRLVYLLFFAPLALGVGYACSATNTSTFGEGEGAGAGKQTGATDVVTTGTTTTDEGTFNPGESDGGGEDVCDAGPDEDKDQDGFSVNQGDCNDCDPNVNPNAVEVIVDPNNGGGGAGGMIEPTDEDCDGDTDEAPEVCDANIAINSMDPIDVARAVGLCKIAKSPDESGVQSAQWVSIDGTPAPNDPNFHLGHGVLTGFGPNVTVQEGSKMFAVSSGTARQPNDPDYQDVGGFSKGYQMNHPQGFPKESPSCPNVTTGTPHDGTAVEVSIRVPSNAHGFVFNFNFYTYEWPGYVCSTFNDFFVAILDPIPMGQMDGNISFDQLNNPVSVNNAFLEVCGCANGPPCTAGQKTFTCALGNQELVGTGFGIDSGYADHGATSWLQTSAPADPNSVIKIRWATYDSGDGVLDSTTLIDNWKWIATPGTKVGTKPVPDPK